MQLPARLSASTLGDLLGALHREGTTGLLELVEIKGPRGRTVPGRTHRLHLRGGLLLAVETGLPVPPLGEILRRQGAVTEDGWRVLVSRIRAGDFRATGEILANDGLATEADVRAGLRCQLRERLDAVFALEDATVSFHTARPVPAAVRIQPLAADEFLRGRPRARDRNRRPRDVSPPPPPPPSPPPPPGRGDPPGSGARPIFGDARDRARRLLRLPDGAGLDDVRRAFRRLARVLHPDRIAAGPLSDQRQRQAQFAELSAAYHLLVA